ncbi:hypothetical protein BJ742DRAFT_801759 [Cladochytrium replicatum]|nr:hypothetical protein BJ742DRAFT_801759 [Cladochytrium replicatum]
MRVYSFENAEESQTLTPPNGLIQVDKSVVVGEHVDALKKSEEYSSVYGLILSAGAGSIPVSSMTVEHIRLLDSFQNSLNAYAEKITTETEGRIAVYKASQLAQLESAKRRGTEERDRLMATIVARGVPVTSSKVHGLDTPTPSVGSGLSIPSMPTGASFAKSVEMNAEKETESMLAQFASSFRPRRMVPSGVSWKDEEPSSNLPPLPESVGTSRSKPEPISGTEPAAASETVSNVEALEVSTNEKSEISLVAPTSLPQIEERSSPKRVKFVEPKEPETSEMLTKPPRHAQPVSENGIFDLEGVDGLNTDQNSCELPTDNDVDEEVEVVEQFEDEENEGGVSNFALLSSSVPIAIPGSWMKSKKGRSAPTGPSMEDWAEIETGDSEVFVAPHIVTAQTYAGEQILGGPAGEKF